MEPPIKPGKPATNRELIQTFCGIVKDTVENKVWKEEIYKIIAEKSAYLLLLNKRTRDEFDFITANRNAILLNFSYHYTDSFDSIINENFIWFIQELITSDLRLQKTQECVKKHYLWKIQKHLFYQSKCTQYIRDRVEWEYNLVRKTLEMKISRITWSTNYSKEKVLRLISIDRINFSENIRDLVETEKSNW